LFCVTIAQAPLISGWASLSIYHISNTLAFRKQQIRHRFDGWYHRLVLSCSPSSLYIFQPSKSLSKKLSASDLGRRTMLPMAFSDSSSTHYSEFSVDLFSWIRI
jgi:hypothetical protein